MKIRFLLLIGCGVMLSGCSAIELAQSDMAQSKMKNLSSGKIGCLPDAITIDVVSAGWNDTAIWKATCKGITHICSYNGNDDGILMDCAKEQ